MSAEISMGQQESEPLDLRTVIDTIPALLVSARPDGYVEFVNQGWRKYSGRALDELTGLGWQAVIHPDDISKLIYEWDTARATGKAFESEARVRGTDGEYHWFAIRKVPLRDHADHIVKWYGAAYDIDDRKRAEERLRQKEKELRTIVETIPAFVGTALPDGSVDFVSQSWLDYMRLSSEEWLGWGWMNVIHPEDLQDSVEKWRAALTDGTPIEHELRIRQGGGEYRWFLARKVPLRDERGNILKWYGTLHDIEDRKRAEEKIRKSETHLRRTIDAIPTIAWCARPDGSAEFWNRRWFDYTGLSAEEARGWGWSVAYHPEDVVRVTDKWLEFLASGEPGEVEGRLRRYDGEYRWFLVRAAPLRDESGNIISWYGTNTDIEGLKRTEDELRRRDAYLAEAQKLSHTGSFVRNAGSDEVFWSEETYKIFEYDRAAKPSLELVLQRVHPDDRTRVQQTIDGAHQGTKFDTEHRLLMPDGRVKYLHVLAHALQNSASNPEVVGAVTDITAAKQAEEALRKSEEQWRDVFENNPTMYLMVDTAGLILAVNPFGAEQLGYKIDELVGQPALNIFYEPDRKAVQRNIALCMKQVGWSMSWELRKVRKDGSVLWVRETARAVLRANDPIILIACEDITERKYAEDKIREQETELRQILDVAPQHVAVLGPDGTRIFLNQAGLGYYGLTLEEWRTCDPQRFFHPNDWEPMMVETQRNLLSGSPHEIEVRLLRSDGKYRWFLVRRNPLRDEQGRVSRWYVAGTDIEDRKREEERLQHQNIALREEIDKASMFEEIVGTSPTLQTVLSRVSKVAPMDSTVLITGDTGTGKELVARAIHRRSRRSARAFVSVNCAAIPRDLITPELFGHEKGAFTGATQQRLGRFELAEGGTIFFDEVGELPAETQVALLRVLQEREFERIGGNLKIRADVRVIAATNRDLEAVVAAGAFRRDLFYRLNVFPIELPPLCERREDISLLVEYFIDRYAGKAGKKIRTIEKSTLKLLQSYPWPGNIRELQNVIERSVILCETDTFSVDESWLSRQPPVSEFAEKLAVQEKEMIESALRKSGGRVSGPSGAAARLGMPRSTLESKIRSLKINKNRFRP
jgi:PAS domain S-box-containing protein